MLRTALIALFAAALAVGCQPPAVAKPSETPAPNATAPAPSDTGWRAKLAETLPKLGHRNWIVVADSAYPWQISPGVETVVTGADQLEVVQAVLDAVKATTHVQAEVLLDAELMSVPEEDAAGIGAYRTALPPLLGDASVTRLKHEEIIAKLDKVGGTFKVLLLKTNMTLPYTSVFVQLNCGYWGPKEEAKMREIIKGAGAPSPNPKAAAL